MSSNGAVERSKIRTVEDAVNYADSVKHDNEATLKAKLAHSEDKLNLALKCLTIIESLTSK